MAKRGAYDEGNFELNESYREIRTYVTINKNIKTILVTSAEMDEGKTTIICNLAKCFSELEGVRVLLIDCDFRKRGVSRYSNYTGSVYFGSTCLDSIYPCPLVHVFF